MEESCQKRVSPSARGARTWGSAVLEVQGLLPAGAAPLAGAPHETLVSGPFVCLLTNCRNLFVFYLIV